MLSKLQNIEKGNHDDKECDKYCKDYKDQFGQELPNCQFKGNEPKIQRLLRKVQIDADGKVTESPTSLSTKMKNLFRRK